MAPQTLEEWDKAVVERGNEFLTYLLENEEKRLRGDKLGGIYSIVNEKNEQTHSVCVSVYEALAFQHVARHPEKTPEELLELARDGLQRKDLSWAWK